MNIDDFKRKRTRLYLSQGLTDDEAHNKLSHWFLNHRRKIKRIIERSGFKITFIKSMPCIDTGCEQWFIDIDYCSNHCNLLHKNTDNDAFHFQKAFVYSDSVSHNVIDICNYIWGHSNKHIQRDFNNTLRNTLHEHHIND